MALNTTQTLAIPKVAATNKQALTEVWKNLEPDSCPYFYNFHMHTTCSDGQLQPEELIEQAVAIGLKGFAITDHHTINGYQVAQSWLEDWQQQIPSTTQVPQLWTGMEITAALLDSEVHILGYAFDPQHPALYPYLQGNAPQNSEAQAGTVIMAIQQAGGLAVLAHPARYRRSAKELIPVVAELGIDGVETYYAYANPKPWQPSHKQTQQVKQLGATYNLLNTCGTDTHGLSLLKRL
ncbi:MAG: PHP domain-containing protein [Symploca sp. SIO2E9]|nr:PHP domain-containing protein [Symploca sp. SIO2E9]